MDNYSNRKLCFIGLSKILLFFAISLLEINTTQAQITQPTAWTKAYDQISGTCSGYSFPVGTGTNRILVVALSHTLTGSATQANPTTFSYGGVTLSNATTNGATSARMHTWLYYLKDNAVMDGTSKALNITLSGTHANVTVWYAVYAGVDQIPATYTTGNGLNNTSGSGPAQLSAAMAIDANQQAIYYSCIYNANNTTIPVYTINANWTSGGNSTGSSGSIAWKNEPAKRTIPGTNTTDNAATSTITPSGSIRYAMSAMSLPQAANPNCPSSTSIAPNTAQSVCLNASANQLTATIILSGGTGTPTLLYQWYYNATNSNTISGATIVSGATSSTYTPPTTATGTRYYFCVGYATNNGCGQTATTQSLASNTVQITVNDLPGAVTVSGGGTFCGTATLTASGGTGGTIYFQGTTSNGTSTSIPSTSQVITSSGTYYFRAMSPQGCWGTQGSATVTIIPNPSITLGANPAVCKGDTFANLTYSTTSGSPNQYSVIYDATAIGQGFANVTNANLPASPIVLIVPSAAIPGTYNFSISVRNSTTGCISDSYPKTITINPPAPVSPGAISGPITVNPFTSGLAYSIQSVIDATSYNWNVPAGWIITNGQGTTSIIVTSGAVGQNGNINVTASNSCGTSAASNLAVVVYDGNCPQSTSVVPPSTQSICPGETINTLSAAVTLSGGQGTPTILYQWYYNNSNSNTIAGAIKLTGETTSTYTPQNIIEGTRYYFCVGYASNNGCNQNDTYQNLASNAVQIIINPPPPASPGSITGQGTVPPNITGLTYSITAVANATSYSWTVPTGWTITAGQGTVSITVTSGGLNQNGNITVTAANSCGVSAASSHAVTVAIIPPTITLGTNPTVCQGTTSANLPYSATTNNPDKYSIDYNSLANAAGFIDIVNANLPVSPIILIVPSGVATGTYFGTLKVKNSATGLLSTGYIINVKVISVPAAPGAITGMTVVSSNSPLNQYSISTVSGATSYTWSVPAGWIITSGQGTKTILVTSGSAGQNGNISVNASNACGTGASSSLAVVSVIPTDHSTFGCSSCHIFHNSQGVALNNVAGNANLCMTCHVTGGIAGGKPFNNAMKALPGTGGTSHNWNTPAINAQRETVTPTNSQMLARLDNGEIVCSTCHDQHNPNTFGSYLRATNTGDALCKDCHAPRNVGRYSDNTLMNKGSHPVGVIFNSSDPGLLSAPIAPYNYPGNKVECSSCHQSHYSTSTDGYLLKSLNDDAVCTSCHIGTNSNNTMTHEGFGCKTCHYTHNPDKSNILMIRNNITTGSGTQTVVFTANSAPGNYADGSAPFNGICEVCHTNTDHYSNTSGGTSDARHNPATQNCVDCHPHNTAFSPVTDCFECHKAVTDKVGVGPPGGRRQIVDNSGNGLGTGGDFKRTSHHVSGSIPSVADCIKCHYMGDHMRGTVKLLDPDLGYLSVITYDPVNKASIESFCLKCHDSNGANGSTQPFSDNITVPVVDATMWNTSSHKGSLTCLDCHDNGHGSNKSVIIGPYNYTGPGTGTDLMNEEEGFCLTCHGASGSATVKVHLAFSSYTNTTTNFYKHDPTATYRIHDSGESGGGSFGGANRHVECVDCHNPHSAKAGTATAPVLLPTMTGAKGVEPIYSGPGAPTGFTWMASVTAEYQVCYKCHSSYTTLPSYLPGGWNSSTLIADGLKKLTTGGTNGQIADSRDMAREYNPNNQSFHPVMAAGKNLNINASSFQTGWTFTSRVYCTSCHNNSNSSTAGHGRGPHGSANLHLLDKGTGGSSNYKTVHNEVTAVTTAVCTKCHQAGSYYTGNTGSRFGFHLLHVNDKARGECYLCHDTHGSEQFHLFNFNRNVTSCITAYGTNSQSSFVHATGTSSNSCTVTCHGTSHGTGKSYNPAYN